MQQDDDGETPLHSAAKRDGWHVAEVLLANGAKVNAKDNDGNTPLLSCWFRGGAEIEMVKVLLANKADPNVKSSKGGWTPLHKAAARGEILAELLLAHGADVNPQDDDGETPLDWANRGRGPLKLLHQHGALRGKELAGTTPKAGPITSRLVFAVSGPSPELVIIITNGAVGEFNRAHPGVIQSRKDPEWVRDGNMVESIVIQCDSQSQVMSFNAEFNRLFAKHQRANGVNPDTPGTAVIRKR